MQGGAKGKERAPGRGRTRKASRLRTPQPKHSTILWRLPKHGVLSTASWRAGRLCPVHVRHVSPGGHTLGMCPDSRGRWQRTGRALRRNERPPAQPGSHATADSWSRTSSYVAAVSNRFRAGEARLTTWQAARPCGRLRSVGPSVRRSRNSWEPTGYFNTQ